MRVDLINDSGQVFAFIDWLVKNVTIQLALVISHLGGLSESFSLLEESEQTAVQDVIAVVKPRERSDYKEDQ